MTNTEWTNLNLEKQNIFGGILFHNRTFGEGEAGMSVAYDFSCPEYEKLRETYALKDIAGRGGDFVRAKRLMHHLAPRLYHSSWYDNHVPCNALDLLAYSLDNPEQGINCLNKSKILAECCLALGIPARRVGIYPYSPYDFDNHVVTEIYDRKLKKWIMLDLTTDGYFVDAGKNPMSLVEIRDKFANDEFVTFVRAGDRLNDLSKRSRKYAWHNAYICKNLFYLAVEKVNRFGPGGGFYFLCPEGFRIRTKEAANAQYRLSHMPPEHGEMIAHWQKRLEEIQSLPEPEKIGVSVLQAPPKEEK